MKTAIIIIDHGSKYSAANDALDLIVDLAKKKSPNCIVLGAHMELAEPSIHQAFKDCVEQGASHIIAHPFMLSPGRHAIRDIPNIVDEVALDYPNITYEVTPPLGCDERIVDVILSRCGVDS